MIVCEHPQFMGHQFALFTSLSLLTFYQSVLPATRQKQYSYQNTRLVVFKLDQVQALKMTYLTSASSLQP